jgi:glucose/arabinose dehydrogenase
MTQTVSRYVAPGFLSATLIFILSGTARAQLQAVPYVSGLQLPVGFVQDPSNPSIQYVIEQAGRIRAIVNGTLLSTLFLDVSSLISCCGEQGLLGLAFPADYATSRRLYINYTNAAGNTVVARYLRSASNPLIADPTSRFPLRWGGVSTEIFQPFANHNGGHIAFGPDGYLYVGMGDGGSANDPQNYAQNARSLLGKMLPFSTHRPALSQRGT